MKRTPVIHPFLFAVSPVLFLFAHNVRLIDISFRELLLPLAGAVALAAVLWLLFILILRDAYKAGTVASLGVLLFFLYGHVFTLLGGKPRLHNYLGLAGLVLLVGAAILLGRTRRKLTGLTIGLNLMSAAILAVNLATALPALARPASARKAAAPGARDSTAAGPDIYYIILDGYARSDFLKAKFKLDNSEFLDRLRQRGFYVADRSRSNYTQTHLSLASSLSYTYHDELAAKLGPESDNRVTLTRMIAQGRVTEFLRRRGYTITAFESGYSGVEVTSADVRWGPKWALSEFQNVLISTTPLPLLLDRVLHRTQFDLHRERMLYTLNNLPHIARGHHPAFVFAHLAAAHPPFVFGANGEKVTPAGFFTMTGNDNFQVVDEERIKRDYAEGYGQQVTYLNRRVIEAVDGILANSPRPPVIIIQGDHGAGSVLNWDDPDRSELPDRVAILNAIRIPAADAPMTNDQAPMTNQRTPDSAFRIPHSAFPRDSAFRTPYSALLYDSISPVNTFRVLFTRLFDTVIPLLPDKSYFSTITKPYRFYDLDRLEDYPTQAAAISVVAFPITPKPPENPPVFSRQVVTIKYRDTKKSIRRFFVKNLKDDVTVAQAYELYRKYVATGELPDLGTEYESYAGKGPNRDRVVALFFPVR